MGNLNEKQKEDLKDALKSMKLSKKESEVLTGGVAVGTVGAASMGSMASMGGTLGAALPWCPGGWCDDCITAQCRTCTSANCVTRDKDTGK